MAENLRRDVLLDARVNTSAFQFSDFRQCSPRKSNKRHTSFPLSLIWPYHSPRTGTKISRTSREGENCQLHGPLAAESLCITVRRYLHTQTRTDFRDVVFDVYKQGIIRSPSSFFFSNRHTRLTSLSIGVSVVILADIHVGW